MISDLWEYNEHINYLELPYNATILPNVSYEIFKHVYLFLWRNLENKHQRHTLKRLRVINKLLFM